MSFPENYGRMGFPESCEKMTIFKEYIEMWFAANPPFDSYMIRGWMTLDTLVGIPKAQMIILNSENIKSLRGIPRGLKYLDIYTKGFKFSGTPKGINEFGNLPSSISYVILYDQYGQAESVDLKAIQDAVYERFFRGLCGLRIVLLKAFLKRRILKGRYNRKP